MPKLIKPAAGEWPSDAGWLVPNGPEANCTPLQYAVVLRALKDVGILEVPLASNRGVRIDKYLRRAGVPEELIKAGKGWWCAAAAGAWLLDCGVPVPADYAATRSWLPFVGSKRTPGAIVLYGLDNVPHHIGIVARDDDGIVLTIEGNRGYAGTTNDGVAVDIGPMLRKDILGYITPEKLVQLYEAQRAA